MFDDSVFTEMLGRINALTPESDALWGSMSASQMLAHCAGVQEVGNGKDLVGTPFIAKLMKGFIRKMVVNDKPYAHNVRTHPQYLVRDARDFEEQKKRLIDAVEGLKAGGPVSMEHSLFGEMTGEERGWVSYKHLDHHLAQFGV